MNISTILELVAQTVPERVAVADSTHRLTYADVDAASTRLAHRLAEGGYERVAWLATNSAFFPVVVFGAAKAGVPLSPLNYRLADEQLVKQGERLGRSLVIADAGNAGRLAGIAGVEIAGRDELFAALQSVDAPADPAEPVEVVDVLGEDAALWLFTSGTTGPPKISLLKHRHLSSYILGTVELCAAGDEEAILVSVPPYHIAGLASVLSSFFAGRRMVYLDNFDAAAWVDAAERESITQAMVVPTMLQRILDALSDGEQRLPALRSLSYGGGRMPREVIERALERLPHVGFANAYGLTETSSTIAVLGPEDHRAAIAGDDPAVVRRLTSVGRPVPGIELRIVTETGDDAAPGERGEILVRGPQISGQYLGRPDRSDDDWFHTRDEGELDADGYLFLHGRVDDVIVRGGENISPGEIEDVLRTHPGVADVVVVAQPDADWGEVPVAVFVPVGDGAADEELSALVRAQLRSSRIPARYERRAELPYNELGKVLRLQVKQSLGAAVAP